VSVSRFFRRKHWDEERAREIESYIDIETDHNIARGMPVDEARQAARRKFGNPTLIREEIYRMNTMGMLEAIWQDLRYGARLLRLSPGFATVAILSLALGIGANTAIFQLLDAVRLRTLPVKDPQELAEIKIVNRDHASGNFTGRYSSLTYPQWVEIRAGQQGFSGVAAWSAEAFNLASGGEARFAQGMWVSGGFFDVLKVRPLLGRVIKADDDRPGCGASGVVISYSFWQREFGGDPSALGRTLRLNGHPFPIVGVTPATFFGVDVGRSFDVAVPMCSEPFVKGEDSRLKRRDGWWLSVIGRLKPDWPLSRASAQLNSISTGLFEATLPPMFSADNAKYYLAYKLGAIPAGTGFSDVRRTYSTPLWLLLAIAGLVLLIACANLANLMLARASAREREIAVRLAMGASRGRLIRQLLSESLLLAGAGAIAGALLAQTLSRFLVSFLSTADNPLYVDLNTDWRVLGFTAAVAVLTCLLFGLAPAVRASKTEPGAVMKSSGRGLTAGRERFSLRRLLVASQVALSLVLLVGALLFTGSLRNLLVLDAGFQQNGILIAIIDYTALRVPANRREPFQRELLDTIRAVPGVDSAARALIVTVGGSGWNQNVILDGVKKDSSWLNRVSPGYFKTMGTPLLAGRDFNRRDTATSPKVAIVDQSFARKYFNSGSPVGKTFQLEHQGKPSPVFQIVGLVKDSKYTDLREKPTAIAYFPMSQDDEPGNGTRFLIRSQSPLAGLISPVKRSMAEVSPELNLNFQVFKTQIRDSLLRERLMATLSGFFGFLAVVLATVGLYGVISYMVARRRNEIGIRMALGASRRNVIGLILRDAGIVLGAGLIVGIALALAAARTAASMLFGLKPYDPAIIALAVGSLGLVALAASYLPARRAARLDPMAALREE
jgi:predicted permease